MSSVFATYNIRGKESHGYCFTVSEVVMSKIVTSFEPLCSTFIFELTSFSTCNMLSSAQFYQPRMMSLQNLDIQFNTFVCLKYYIG